MNKKLVIVGAGFAGLKAAQELGGQAGLDITLLDRRNHHLFQPLLYQVATAGLSPAEIAAPVRSILSRHANIRVLLADVVAVDLAAKKILLKDGQEAFDYLLIATGASHSYFGHPEWESFAPGLKTLEQATEIRRRVLLAFEDAERCGDADRRRELLTFAVIGAGPTGVELAGTLGEISRFALSRDFRRIDPSSTRVILIEAGPRILPSFDEALARHAARDLEALGVQIWCDSRVTQLSEQCVTLGHETLRAATVLWAAGVEPSPLGKSLGVPLDRLGRVIVEPDLSVPGYPHVFVLGDLAHFADPEAGVLPGLAPVAMQQGRAAARNIRADLQGKARRAFEYKDKGLMATIGRRRAIAQIGRHKLTGFSAWCMWLLVHIYFLIGFKNRLFVLLQWAYSYFSYRRGARLIVGKEWKTASEPPSCTR